MYGRAFDPYDWSRVRQNRALYFVDYGVRPGLIAGVAYAALIALLGGPFSPYWNATVFALLTTPIYMWLSHRAWEANEDAFAAYVVEQGRHLAGQVTAQR